MMKKLFLIAILSLCLSNVYASWKFNIYTGKLDFFEDVETTSGWSVSGSYVFNTLQNSYIGIGTTAPTQALDIVGNIKISSLTDTRIPFVTTGGLLTDNGNFTYIAPVLGAQTIVKVIHNESENTANDSVIITQTQSGGGNAYYCSKVVSGTTWCWGIDNEGDSFKIASSGTLSSNTRFTIDNTGLVGINKTVPIYQFDVNGTGRIGETFTISAPSAFSGSQSTGTSGYSLSDELVYKAYSYRTINGNKVFKVTYSTVNQTIAANGNNVNFTITKGATTDGIRVIRTYLGGDYGVDITTSGNYLDDGDMGGGIVWTATTTVTPTDGDFSGVLLDWDTGAANIFDIYAVKDSALGISGNVGIGTTVPGSKLTVSGNISIGGNILKAGTFGSEDLGISKNATNWWEFNNGTTTASQGGVGYTSVKLGTILGYGGNQAKYYLDASTPLFAINNIGYIGWVSGADAGGTVDTAFYRNSAGVVEINNGTAGTMRDMTLRNLTASGTMTVGGKLGIGTTNPINTLSVVGSMDVGTAIITAGSITTSKETTLTVSGSATVGTLIGTAGSLTTVTTGLLVTSGTGISYTGGYLGIGTTNPQVALMIVGSGTTGITGPLRLSNDGGTICFGIVVSGGTPAFSGTFSCY